MAAHGTSGTVVVTNQVAVEEGLPPISVGGTIVIHKHATSCVGVSGIIGADDVPMAAVVEEMVERAGLSESLSAAPATDGPFKTVGQAGRSSALTSSVRGQAAINASKAARGDEATTQFG